MFYYSYLSLTTDAGVITEMIVQDSTLTVVTFYCCKT